MGLLDAPVHNSKSLENHLYNFQSANFLKWRKALVDVRNGTADAKLLCVGDSTTAGIRSSTSATVPQNKSYPAQLAALMNAYLVPTTRGLAIPKSSSTAQVADTRWSATGTFALGPFGSGSQVGWGNKSTYWYSTSSTAVLTFADGVNANTYDVYYVDAGGAAFTIQATGGSSVPVTVGGTLLPKKATCVAGSAGTSNTVTITSGTGGNGRVFIIAVEPSLSTTKQARVGNVGASGADTVGWVSYPFNVTSNTYGSLDCIKAYAPHLTIIDLGINDALVGTSQSTYAANLALITAAAQVSGDVIFKTMLPSSPAETPTSRIPMETAYVNGIKNLGLPVIDVFNRIGSYTTYSAAGFMFGGTDYVHGNDYSYGDEAAMVLTALQSI